MCEYNSYSCYFTVDMASGLAYETLFANQGQICASPSRIFVHEKIHDEFVKKVLVHKLEENITRKHHRKL